MYAGDHDPPHFHAVYNEHMGLIDIRRLQLMEGYLPKREAKLVLERAAKHQVELMRNWRLIEKDQQPLPIAPLE